MSGEKKHLAISRQILLEISSGKYRPGSRLPSEAQLVERFQVSRPTAISALRDLQTAGVIERRGGSGSYVRNTRIISTGLRQIGLLIPGLGATEIFEVICGELASLARVHEYGLLWGASSAIRPEPMNTLQQAFEVCDQFISRRVNGVFFAPFELTADNESASRQVAEKFRMAGIPVVLLDRDLVPYPARSDFDLISVNNVLGGYMLAEHLFKLGCKQIAFVVRPNSAPAVDARISGIRESISRRQIVARPDWLQKGDPADERFVRSLISPRRWDAFICANDYTAATLIRSLERLKTKVPANVRVVGFDDVRYATFVSVPLTTVHQPCREIAMTAFQAMLDRIEDPVMPARFLQLNPRLIVRESCGAYASR